ncbi:heparan-alpha-glucosaminide N-acetyltransferase domain-containing protein [Kibdelosporangium philippinense]|uniref:Heparan-alpha-glucosaminide N-acetyltransferase domain-containing protein n=1 Tax=Kibdelosporangium philippinense TaxID=211113 RepID=A0ABS8Z0Q0_9PSEU|nr:heparan-alpha-glucosaminide N-acetyltransferase domain-containing protein [Kibdelosporangium philippinense]MCE7001538.1 heparan-alpha-glucosaminide N-acetyltransferase domain-containing protein [Kibdelosporangium philippinense]
MNKRIAGIDLARGLAVFGMFAVHVGPDPARTSGLLGDVMQATHGRSSVLFATLAGLSLALITGRQQPNVTSRDYFKIAIRAVILIALGTYLTLLGTNIAVILAYYGTFFVLAMPFLRLRASWLFGIAGALALIGPFVAILSKQTWTTWAGDPLEQISGQGVLQFLLTGYYPAVTWMPYVLAGIALGRLDLTSAKLRMTLLTLGPVMAIAGYGGSAIAIRQFGSRFAPQPLSFEWLLEASPHSNTTFEIVGALGVAMFVLSFSLYVAEWIPTLVRPIMAVGTMSLTLYTAHLFAIAFLTAEGIPTVSMTVLVLFIAVSALFATVWLIGFRRGPLEYGLHGVTRMVPQDTPPQQPRVKSLQSTR